MASAPHPAGNCTRCLLLGVIALAGAILLLICAVVAWQLEEDARGAAAWKKTAAVLSARGISLDRADYQPADAPPAQNFGALPLFAIEPDPSSIYPQAMRDGALKRALDPLVSRLPYHSADQKEGQLPFWPSWEKMASPDMNAMRAALAESCRRTHPGASPAPDTDASALLSQICPALDELRSVNVSRPLCVFPRPYDIQPIRDFPFALISGLLPLARALTFDARLALYTHHADRALDDLAVDRKVALGLEKEPFLISGLVAIVFEQDEMKVVEQGLTDHAWSDAQLAELERNIGSFDALAAERHWMAGELIAFDQPVLEGYRKHRWLDDNTVRGFQNRPLDFEYKPPFLTKLGYFFSPVGWLDVDRATYVRYWLVDVLPRIDPAAHRVYADRIDAETDAIRDKRSWSFWSVPVVNLRGPMSAFIKQGALLQARLDEARIACRLERYRLEYGTFPESIEALATTPGGPLPSDIMNGRPYHYQRRADGTYLLYSVAWNQEDDHGEHEPNAGQSAYDALDWVWQSRREVPENHF